jgi:hypothetical protein
MMAEFPDEFIRMRHSQRAEPHLSAKALVRAKSGLQLIWDVTEFGDRVNFSV